MTVQTPSTPSALSGTGAGVVRMWLPMLISVVMVCGVFSLIFRPEIGGAVRVWSESTAYNHCFLVLPMAALLVWNRREGVATLRPSRALWALLLLIPLSAAWLMAALLDVLEAAQLVVVAIFDVLLLAAIGWRAFRALLAPLLFLFFLVPFGAFLVPVLQRITAAIAIAGLQLLDIPVFAEGMTIQIPEGYFEVAEACAGLRFLIASLVFGCFFATIVYHSPVRRAAFIALSTGLPIIANGFRAFGLILLGHFEGSATAVSADHVLYGWIFFTLVTLLLIAIGMTFAERRGSPALAIVGPPRTTPVAGLSIVATIVAGLVIVVLGPGYLMWVERTELAPLDRDLLRPQTNSAWLLKRDAAVDWQPAADGASRQSIQTYTDGKATVTQFVALYPLPVRGSPLTRSGNSVADPKEWRITKTGQLNASIGDTTIAVNTMSIGRDARHRLIWWFYLIDGHATGSMFKAKLLQARTALEGGSHFGALVAISIETDEFAPNTGVLDRFLSSASPYQASGFDVPGLNDARHTPR